MNSGRQPSFTLGCWLVEPARGHVSVNGETTRIEPRLMDLLTVLAEANGAFVAKEEIIERVWGGRPIGDEALTSAVYRLRRVLDREASHASFIETLPKRGYRIAVDVGAPRAASGADLVARGRALLLNPRVQSIDEACIAFEAAALGDPACAAALAGLGEAGIARVWMGVGSAIDELPIARDRALSALSLEPQLASAHAVLGFIDAFFDRNVAEAERRLAHARNLDSSNIAALRYCAYLSTALGEFGDAVNTIGKAIATEPVTTGLRIDLAHILIIARRYDDALFAADELSRLHQKSADAWIVRGWAHQFRGRMREAYLALREGFALMGFSDECCAALDEAWREGGFQASCGAAYSIMRTRAPNWSPCQTDLAILCASAGDREGALSHLGRAEADRQPLIAYACVAPHYDALRGIAEFVELAGRTALRRPAR